MNGVRSCPRCRVDLFRGEAAGVTMLGCGRCGGVWLDNAAVRRIQEVAPDDAIALADQASEHAVAAIDARAPVSCPACAKPMARTPVQAARVEVDSCSAHGTWFDKSELHAVAAAFAEIRKRRGPSRGYVVAGVAAGAVAVGVAGALASQDPGMQSRAQSMASSATDVVAGMGSSAVDVVGTVAEVAVDVAGSGALDVAGDVAVGAIGLIFSIFD